MSEVAAKIRGALPPEASPPDDADDLFVLYALLARTKGAQVTLSDVHDAWAAWIIQRREEHKALIPYESLDEETKAEDAPYLTAIHAVVNAWQGHDEA
jgi:hypothetical protein